MQTAKILVGGDLVPTESNFGQFSSANSAELFGDDLLNILNQADFRIFNLEVPLTDESTPINKCGPNLVAPTNTINGIKQIGTDLMTLANNHILDQGVQGLDSTLKVLDQEGIAYLGAGSNIDEAARAYVTEIKDVRIGVYACAEHEFSIATWSTPGANPFDPLESPDHIKDLKERCDYVIVLYHGGKEHYQYPSPYLQKTCRKMADKGADLIICQHSHCIGAFENYSGHTIVYGQGNFLFDNSEIDFWQTSLLVLATITNEGISAEYIPLVKKGSGVRLADKQHAEQIMQNFSRRSSQIVKEAFVQAEYERFATQMISGYLTAFLGDNYFFRVLNKLSGHRLATKLHSNKSFIKMRNYLECEAHRELLLTGLNAKIRK